MITWAIAYADTRTGGRFGGVAYLIAMAIDATILWELVK